MKVFSRLLPVLRAGVFTAGLLGLAGCGPGPDTERPPEAKSRPNLIVVMTDDQGYGDYGFMGNPVLQTPHLDSMAARSAQMSQFYVSPVCSPTRASLMTGRYNYRTRVVDTWIGRSMMEPSEVTLAEILRDAGYATGLFGKWHLGDNYPLRPQDQGFEEVLMHRGGGIGQPSDPPKGEGQYTDPVLFHNGAKTQTDGYVTDVIFERALDWIRARSQQETPFFAYIPTNAPHAPFHDVPDSLLAVYQEMDLGNDQFPQDGYPLPDEADPDRRARIYSMITNIDQNIGRLFEGLREMGLTENTLVVFLGDNGPNGRRYVGGLRGRKASVYEGGVRTPFLMHWPGTLSGDRVSSRPAAHIDVLPTVLEALDVPAPEGRRLDGRSFWPQISGESATWTRRPIVIQSHRGDVPTRYHQFMVRRGRWKLVHPSGFGRNDFEGEPDLELYDLEADPSERNDLSASRPEVVDELRAAYNRWFDDVSTTRPGNYGKPRMIVGTRHQDRAVLTRQDWHPTNDAGWGALEATGYWSLSVAEEDTFDVRVRYPEGFDGGTVTLYIDPVHYQSDERAVALGCPPGEECPEGSHSAIVEGSAGGYTFRDIVLRPGPIRISGDLQGEQQTGGAWQIVLEER